MSASMRKPSVALKSAQNAEERRERRIAGLCCRSKHPAYQAVAHEFGKHRHDMASQLCTGVSLLHRAAMRKRQDGWLTRTQALKAIAPGAHPRTAARYLVRLLTVEAHFGEREDGLVWLRSLFLGEAKRAEQLARWNAELDAKALVTRAARGTSCTEPILRRAKFGPPPLPTSHSTEGPIPVEPLLESVGEKRKIQQYSSDPPREVGEDVGGRDEPAFFAEQIERLCQSEDTEARDLAEQARRALRGSETWDANRRLSEEASIEGLVERAEQAAKRSTQRAAALICYTDRQGCRVVVPQWLLEQGAMVEKLEAIGLPQRELELGVGSTQRKMAAGGKVANPVGHAINAAVCWRTGRFTLRGAQAGFACAA